MFSFADLSIKKKLMRLCLITSGTALVLARILILGYDHFTFKAAMVRSLTTQAEIIGFNSASALLFHDPAAAVQTLSALRVRPNIVYAGIYNKQDQPFAVWNAVKNDNHGLPPVSVEDRKSHRFSRDSLELFNPIIFDGARIGTVYIKANLSELKSRLLSSILVTVIVLLVSFLVAIWISIKLGDKISGPILDLVNVAQSVSEKKDYSVRAKNQSHDEIGLLVKAFNNMLNEIQISSEELRASHEELEQRVVERTAQLEASNKELEAFSYSVSHDLRAPLRSIDGFSLAVVEDSADKLDEESKGNLQRIRNASQQMAQLIDDMLNLSRISRSGMSLEEVNMSMLIQSVATGLIESDSERKVKFDITPDMVVKGDSRLLKIMLENLFSNAWKFTSKKPEAKIEFGIFSRNGANTYFVRDNGAGFDMAYVNKLFGPFQRLHSTAEFNGTGVGLATVQRIINRHGGRIWAEGVVGKGATFFFTL